MSNETRKLAWAICYATMRATLFGTPTRLGETVAENVASQRIDAAYEADKMMAEYDKRNPPSGAGLWGI